MSLIPQPTHFISARMQLRLVIVAGQYLTTNGLQLKQAKTLCPLRFFFCCMSDRLPRTGCCRACQCLTGYGGKGCTVWNIEPVLHLYSLHCIALQAVYKEAVQGTVASFPDLVPWSTSRVQWVHKNFKQYREKHFAYFSMPFAVYTWLDNWGSSLRRSMLS